MILSEEPQNGINLWFNYLSTTTESWCTAATGSSHAPRYLAHHPRSTGQPALIALK